MRIMPHWLSNRKQLAIYPAIAMLAAMEMLLVTADSNAQQPAASETWRYLDNGQLKIGVKVSSGAAIGWISRSGSDLNLVNHFDRGRLIQQSYYGQPDGSTWDKQPWRWNPVQGGHYLGAGAPILELKVEGNKLYSKSHPMHWATGETLTDCVMEQTIELQDQIAKIHFRFAYSGNTEHPTHDQEIPAVFIEPEFKHLVLYTGPKPWTEDALERSVPGWPNESRKMTEQWAAYVDSQDFGLGVYVPAATHLTCYRFGDGKRELGACSYFAPLVRFAVKPGFEFEYDVYATIGKVDAIRAAFRQLHLQSGVPK